MSFSARTRDTRGEDWVEGTRREDGRMAYEDMIEPGENWGALIEELEAMGPWIVL